MDQLTTSVLQWWRKKRLLYNQRMLFTALIGFVVQAVQQPFNKSPSNISDKLMFEMRLSAVCLFIFLILANVAFTAGCILDLIFNSKNSSFFRERLFFFGCWFAIASLILSVITFLYLI